MRKYLKLSNYVNYGLRFINGTILESVEQIVSPSLQLPLRHPPIFFLGPPRSGSTLVFQSVTDVFDVGYISNAHSRWYGAPAIYERIFHPTANRPQSDYRSNHGNTEGYFSPSECGEWWYRFFRQNPSYVTLDEVNPYKMQKFRRSVAALTMAFDRPVVFKNLYASLRIQAIAKYLPESLFIVMHRDEIGNGHSLLEARYKRFGSYEPWFSLEPPGIERLKNRPPHEQVIGQIRNTYRTINEDMCVSEVDAKRRFDLNYEEFCKDPEKMIQSMRYFFDQNSCSIEMRNVSLPNEFRPNSDIRIDKNIYDAMVAYVQSAENAYE